MSYVGVYIHFPWCRKRCPYCDFAVELGDPPHRAYADAVIAELHARRHGVDGELASIYFGGGTPSLWAIDDLARVIDAVRSSYAAIPREITVEANPIDCTAQNLDAWRAAGVNRLSIGVQSHDPDELVVLGRDHRFGEGREAVARAIAHGGFTVSSDFILGTPTKHRASRSWETTDHLSVYELTIEERTPFGRMARDGVLVPRDEDELYDLYVAAHDELTAAGYEHYEISSYAKPGKRAVHNSLYWTGNAYLGLGASAASLELPARRRVTNARRADAYLAGAPPEITPYDDSERLWLGMRTSDGVLERDIPPEIAAKLVEEGLATRSSARIVPTLRGFLLANRVAGMLG